MVRSRLAVLNFMKCENLDTHVASNRIAVWLARHLSGSNFVDFIDRPERCTQKKYDAVLVVNGPFGFCNFREQALALLEMQEKIVWISNDIAIEVPSQVKRLMAGRSVAYWAAHDNFKGWVNHKYVNWNALTFVPGRDWREPKYRGVAYYGAWREDRVDDFKKYLGPDVPYPVFVSSSVKGITQFKRMNRKIQPFNMDNLIRDFGAFETTIYIEDEKSHQVYSSPANRFYECLSSGVLQLFDGACLGTFKRAGIDVTRWLVNGPDDVPQFRANYNQARAAQRKLYETGSFRQELESQVSEAFSSTF